MENSLECWVQKGCWAFAFGSTCLILYVFLGKLNETFSSAQWLTNSNPILGFKMVGLTFLINLQHNLWEEKLSPELKSLIPYVFLTKFPSPESYTEERQVNTFLNFYIFCSFVHNERGRKKVESRKKDYISIYLGLSEKSFTTFFPQNLL